MWTRRRLIQFLGFATLSFIGCNSKVYKNADSSPTPTPDPNATPTPTPTPDASDSCTVAGNVSFNNTPHAHSTVNMTLAEIDAGVAGAYQLLGGGHTHTFTLTAANFTTLKGGGTVNKNDNEGHGHTISILCS